MEVLMNNKYTPHNMATYAMRMEGNNIDKAIDTLLNSKEYSPATMYGTIDEACKLLSNIRDDVVEQDADSQWDKLMLGYREYELYDDKDE